MAITSPNFSFLSNWVSTLNRGYTPHHRKASSDLPKPGNKLSSSLNKTNNRGEDLTHKKKYCNTKRQLVCIHVALLVLVLGLIIGLIAHFVIVPSIIRAKFQSLPLSSINIYEMDITSFEEHGLTFKFVGSIEPILGIPITVRITPSQIYLQTSTSNGWDAENSLCQLKSSAFDLNLQNPQLSFEGDQTFIYTKSISDLVTEFSNKKGFDARTFYVLAKVDIAIFGVTIYKDFDLQKSIELSSIPELSLDILKISHDWIKSVPEFERLSQPSDHIWTAQKLFSVPVGIPPVMFHSISVENHIVNGPTLVLDLSVLNPTIITFRLPPVSFWISIGNKKLICFHVEGVHLSRGKSRMNLRISIEISPNAHDQMSAMVYELSSRITGNNSGTDLPLVSFTGPVVLEASAFVSEITQTLNIPIPVSKMEIPKFSDLVPFKAIQTILQLAQVNVATTLTRILNVVDLRLPFALPFAKLAFGVPFYFSLTTSYAGRNMVEITVKNLFVDIGDAEITLHIEIVLTPATCVAAAEGLRDFVNGVVDNRELVVVGIHSIKVLDLDQTVTPWSIVSLTGLALKIPLPQIDIWSLINTVTNRGSGIPLAARSLLVHQLNNVPGFHTESSFNLLFPEILSSGQSPLLTSPKLSINIGFVKFSLLLDEKPIAYPVMSGGIKMVEGRADSLSADILFSVIDQGSCTRKASTHNVYNIASVGVGDFYFGHNELASFHAFSLIRIALPMEKLRPIISSFADHMLQKVYNPDRPILKVSDVDIKVTSSVIARTNIQLHSGWQLDLSIGRMSFNFGIDGHKLATVHLGAIRTKPSNNKLSLSMEIDMHNSSVAADSVKILIESAWQSLINSHAFISSQVVFVSRVTIVSPSEKKAGLIHQISHITTCFPIKSIFPYLVQASQLFDTSRIVPRSIGTFINELNQTLDGADIATLPDQSIHIIPTLSVQNPLSVSISMSNISLDMLLNNEHLLTFKIARVKLAAKATSTLSPSIYLKFRNNAPASVRNSVASLVNEILDNGKIQSTQVGITSFQFGNFADDLAINVLAKAVLNLPLSSIDINVLGRKVMGPIVSLIPSIDSALNGAHSFHPKFRALSILTLPDSSLELGVSVKITNPIPISLKIEFVSFDFLLDGVCLGNVQLSPLSVGRGRSNIHVRACFHSAHTHDSIARMNLIKEFVHAFFMGSGVNSRFGLNKFVLGSSSIDIVTSFQHVEATMLTALAFPHDNGLSSAITKRLITGIDMISNGSSSLLIPVIHGLDLRILHCGLDMQPKNRLTHSISIRLESNFDIDINVGYFCATAFLSHSRLVEISSEKAIKIQHNRDTTLRLNLLFNSNTDIPDHIAAFVAQVLDHSKFIGWVHVSQLAVGNSHTDKLDMFSMAEFGFSVRPVLTPIIRKIKAVVKSMLDTFIYEDVIAIENGAITISPRSDVYLSIRDLFITSGPSNVVRHGATVDADFPFPVSCIIPFFRCSVSLNNQQVVTITTRNIIVRNGSISKLKFGMDMEFDTSGNVDLDGFVSRLFKGHSLHKHTVAIHSLQFGASETDNIVALSRAKVYFNSSIMDPVVYHMADMARAEIEDVRIIKVNDKRGSFKVMTRFCKMTVATIEMSTMAHQQLLVQFDVQVLLPVDLRVNLGHFSSSLLLGNEMLGTLETSLDFSSNDRKRTMSFIICNFGNGSRIQKILRRIASKLISQEFPLPESIGLSDVSIGHARDDIGCKLFTLPFKLPLQTIVNPLLHLLPDLPYILDFPVQLSAINVHVSSGGVLVTSVELEFGRPLPFSAWIGFASFTFNFGSHELVSTVMENIQLTPYTLSFTSACTFSKSSQSQASIAALFHKPGALLTNLHFGHTSSHVDAIGLMSMIQFDVAMDVLKSDKVKKLMFKQIGLDSSHITLQNVMDRFVLNDIKTVVRDSIEIQGSVSIKIPFRCNADIPLLGFTSLISGSQFADLLICDIKATTSIPYMVELMFLARIDVNADKHAQEMVASLISCFLEEHHIPSQLHFGMGNFFFGSSDHERDIVGIAYNTKMESDVSQLISKARRIIFNNGLDLVKLTQYFGLCLDDIQVSSEPKSKSQLDVKVSISYSYKQSIEFLSHYLAMTVGLGEVAGLAVIHVGPIQIRPDVRKSLVLKFGIEFLDTLAGPRAVVEFMHSPSKIILSRIRFGLPPSKLIDMLGQSTINIPALYLFNKRVIDLAFKTLKLEWSDLEFPKLMRFIQIKKINVDIGKTMKTDVNISLKVPMKVSVNIPFASMTSRLDRSNLAFIEIRDIQTKLLEDKWLKVKCVVHISFIESTSIIIKVAQLANRLISRDQTLPVIAGIRSFTFGPSHATAVQTLSLIDQEFDIMPMIDRIRSHISSHMATIANSVVVESAEVALKNSFTLVCKPVLNMTQLPILHCFTMTLQFASFDLYLNNELVISPQLTSFTLAKGKLFTSVELLFSQDPNAISELGMLLSQLGNMAFFHPVRIRPLTVRILEMYFGSSSKSLVRLASMVDISVDFAPYFKKMATWYIHEEPMMFDDMHAVLTPRGIEADVDMIIRPLKDMSIQLNIPSMSGRVYYRGLGNRVMMNTHVNNLSIINGHFRFYQIIAPVFPDVMEGLNDAFPLLVSFQDLARDAFLGGSQMHTVDDPRNATPDQTFMAFDTARLKVPALIFYNPIELRPILINPFADGIGLDVEVSFTNRGPLHITGGNLMFKLENTYRRTTLATVSVQNFVLTNKHEQSRNVHVLKMRINSSIKNIPQLMYDIIHVRHPIGLRADIRVEESTELKWINQIVEHLPPALFSKMWMILFNLVENSELHLLPNDDVTTTNAPEISRRWANNRLLQRLNISGQTNGI